MSRKIVILGVAAAAGALVAGVACTAAIGVAMAADDSPVVPSVKTNARGESYGSLYGVKPGEEPDLIMATSAEGVQGFVRFSDIQDPVFKTPEEALAWQASHSKDRTVPLYAADGVTKIGNFTVEGPRGGVVNKDQ